MKSIHLLTDDIVVYDSGSTDGTIEILKKWKTRFYEGEWEGFGKTRQKVVALTKYEWVLVIDADEIISGALAEELKNLKPQSDHVAYSIELKNLLGGNRIKWGSWGHDYRIRLYNKNYIRWNEAIVHEKPVIPNDALIQKLKNPIFHYTAGNKQELWEKMQHYALLTAEQYHRSGKRSTWIKRSSGPFFAFVKNYFFKLGFLDGKNGYDVASIIARYTYLKYHRLHEIENEKKNS